MLKKLLLWSLLGISFQAAAQTDFRPGYVVMTDGDTLRGEVDARGAQRNARLVRFRATPAATVTDYQPRQLQGYGLSGGRTYQTQTISLADSLQQQSFAQIRLDTLRQPVFLETVVRGSLSLLFLEDRLARSHYYLRTPDGQVKELIQSVERVVGSKSLYGSGIESTYKTGVAPYDKKTNDFRYTLQKATRQCFAVQPAIVEVKFALTPLARLVKRYNECVGDIPSLSPSLRPSPVRLVVLAGVGGSRLALTDNRFFLQVRSTTTAGIRPIVGVGLHLPLNRISEKLALRLEALYHAQRYQTAVVSDGVLGTVQYQYRANIQSVRIPLLLRYTWPKGQIRPFLQAGYGVSYLLTNTSEARQVFGPNQPPLPSQKWDLLLEGSRLEAGLLGSIGVTREMSNQRNAALEFRLERTNGFAGTQGVSSGLTRYFLLLSYDLTK